MQRRLLEIFLSAAITVQTGKDFLAAGHGKSHGRVGGAVNGRQPFLADLIPQNIYNLTDRTPGKQVLGHAAADYLCQSGGLFGVDKLFHKTQVYFFPSYLQRVLVDLCLDAFAVSAALFP